MPVPGRRALLATVLVAVLVVGSLGLGLRAPSGPRSPVAPTSRAAQPPTLASAQPATSPLPGPAVAAAPTDASNAASRAADAALGASRAAGVRPNVAFVPRPSATAAELASARETGLVAPLYSGTPAPMGLAYYGLRAGPGGEVLGSILNTTRLVATVDLNATGVRAADLFQSSPDS
ncbi:MAG TPA: hypothetical protein VEH10_01365, partial [Thermoplasmata archaeon]|nr:hypothetical protein [Thermoplasmata archaeon]